AHRPDGHRVPQRRARPHLRVRRRLLGATLGRPRERRLHHRSDATRLRPALAAVTSGKTCSVSRRLARAQKLRPKIPSPSLQAVLTFAELLRCTNRGSFHKTARLARKLLEL